MRSFSKCWKFCVMSLAARTQWKHSNVERQEGIWKHNSSWYTAHTHTKNERVCVSKIQFSNQFECQTWVGWCSSLQGKSKNDCCSNSGSRTINFSRLSTSEVGVEEKYELRRGTMFPLNGVRHAFLHFELMIEHHFPPRKGDVLEIVIT